MTAPGRPIMELRRDLGDLHGSQPEPAIATSAGQLSLIGERESNHGRLRPVAIDRCERAVFAARAEAFIEEAHAACRECVSLPSPWLWYWNSPAARRVPCDVSQARSDRGSI